MILLYSSFEPCVLMNQAVIDDEEGGRKITWTDGDSFEAVFLHSGSAVNTIGSRKEAKENLHILTRKDVSLPSGTVFKKVSGSRYFRVSDDTGVLKTPSISALNLQSINAEEMEGLPE